MLIDETNYELIDMNTDNIKNFEILQNTQWITE